MSTMGDILERLLSGSESYHLETHKRLCHVLDLAIDCVSAKEPTTLSTDGNSCSRIWSIDKCWPATPFNTTAQHLCNKNTDQGANTTETDKIISLHCNATTLDWNERLDPTTCYRSFIESVPVVQVEPTTRLHPLNVSTFHDQQNNFYEQSDIFQLNHSDHEMQTRNDAAAETARYQTLDILVTFGHSLSLVTLTVALILFFVLKRLRCTRIFIHMNLMLAFILRGLMWIFHLVTLTETGVSDDDLVEASLSLVFKVFKRYNASDVSTLQHWKVEWCDPFENGHQYYMWCRVYYVLKHYVITASYFWLLVEGLYLASILRAKSPNKSPKFLMRSFLVLGWGLPWLFVIASVLVYTLDPQENNKCWFEKDDTYYWLIIAIPIIISLLINFIIFVLVVRVVGSKLRINQQHQTDDLSEDYRWRLMKSTLALIPLLGIQYIITVFFSFCQIENSTFLFVRATFETFLASIQGFLVALIYCFLNKEVRDEINRLWKTRKTEWELDAANKSKKQNAGASSFISSFNFLRKPNNGKANRRMDSAYTVENSPQRTRYMNTMVTETSRLSTYSLKRGMYLQGVPSPSLSTGPRIKETCLCGDLEKASLKSENSVFGGDLLNDKTNLLPNNNHASVNGDTKWSKGLSTASTENENLLPTSKA